MLYNKTSRLENQLENCKLKIKVYLYNYRNKMKSTLGVDPGSCVIKLSNKVVDKVLKIDDFNWFYLKKDNY